MAVLVAPGAAQSAPTTSAAPAHQAGGQAGGAAPPLAVEVTVVGTTPLPGVEIPAWQLPAPVQTASDRDITRSGALDLSDFLNRQLGGVYVNEVQNNPFQPDVNYRGYTASPLLGTPQGLSVYMDGVRLNQPFGEVVSWDLIPRVAISTITMMPGSNPLFGLNTLGGALSVQTKDGRSYKGGMLQATYGSNARRAFDFDHGGQTAGKGLDWYLAGSLFGEDGWRADSPSDVRQVFGKLGLRREGGDLSVSLGHADNELNGNGLQDARLLEDDYASVYTKPDENHNRSTLVNIIGQRRWSNGTSFLANAYYRDIYSRTLNGDINEDSLDQSVYQPSAAERAALAAAGFGNVPESGLTASNTAFPSLRCIANVLLNDEAADTCNGLINRASTSQHNGGASGQFTHRGSIAGGLNVFTAGAAFDRSSVGFIQSSELGYLNPDRGVTGLGAFADGVTGGVVDGEPYDTRVDLDGVVKTWSVYFTDTLPITPNAHVTLSGRYNRTSVSNRDQIVPGGGPTSLDGDHVFSRFNPAVGITVDISKSLNLYGGYNEGSRAATSIELGCANPEQPCKLPNAMAGDPPLDQVVTRTVEGGVRGARGQLSWHAGAFSAQNRDDILFVTSEQTGFGYFRNFGETRRQGVEAGVRLQRGRVVFGTEYTFLDATFQSNEVVNGESNSSNEEAEEGGLGLEGNIEVERGDRLPLVPRHLLKVFSDMQLTRRLALNVNVVATGGSFARGNENNQHEPDDVYYLGEGAVDGYAVVNLGGRFALTNHLEIIGQLNNLFDRQYFTAAQLGPAGITAAGTFQARPFPAVNGEFPLQRTTFVAPGAPVRAWVGARAKF
jgi:outer membrane receptor protein involved in Fe transport